MFPSHDRPATARVKRGPKPRGRNVYPLSIAVTAAQRARIEGIADRREVTISEVVRGFIEAGLDCEPPAKDLTQEAPNR